jgi:hypothetical protein
MAPDNHEFRKIESRLFLSEGLDRPNQLHIADEISRVAQADSMSLAAKGRIQGGTTSPEFMSVAFGSRRASPTRAGR